MSVAYAWQKSCEESAVQNNFEELPDCIAKAEQAIEKRLADCPPPFAAAPEFEAIGKTLAALAAFKAQIHSEGHVES
jgi:hypothetical protein